MSDPTSTVHEVTDSSPHSPGMDSPQIDLDASTAHAWLAFTERLARLIEQQGPRAIGVFVEEGAATVNRVRIDAEGDTIWVMLRGNAGLPQVLRLSRGAMARARRLGWSRASSASKHYVRLFSANDAGDIAREVSTVLNDVVGVLHPAFLTLVDDLNPAGSSPSVAAPSGTTAPPPPPSAHPPAVLASGVRPSGPRHLDQLVDETLTSVLGRPIERSECGEINIEVGESTVYVHWSTSELVVPLVTPLAASMTGVGHALAVVRELNPSHRGITVLLDGRTVVARIYLPANPYDGELLIGQLSRLCDLVLDHGAEIAQRLQ